uniref:prostate stem cell antigen isoform X1 n=1 Tax=Halichoerus grypus TaxID=9711 RepID=UPI0016599107|nr:prostate stem cell antigen isoform X1 [Halichoerus grypus]
MQYLQRNLEAAACGCGGDEGVLLPEPSRPQREPAWQGVCAASCPWNRQPARSGPPHSRPSPRPPPAACLSASLPARAPRKVLYFSDEAGTEVPEPAAPRTLPAPALRREVEPQGLETILTSALSQYGRERQTRREPGTCPSSAARRPDQGTAVSLGGERPAGSWRSRELSPCPVQPWRSMMRRLTFSPEAECPCRRAQDQRSWQEPGTPLPLSGGWLRVRRTESRRPWGGGQESPEQLPCTRHCFRPCSKHNSKIPSLCIFCPLSSCSWSCSPGYAQSSLPRAQSTLHVPSFLCVGCPGWGAKVGAGTGPGCREDRGVPGVHKPGLQGPGVLPAHCLGLKVPMTKWPGPQIRQRRL